ncbi:MFS transporter [Tsukamurella sp. 1534]|uniref:MFS transporter n=1 Tax=Tsukamurella sp. 1534 TaxID=1151061 RepID=UPI00031BEFDE|nr:MFS transporter [Tsukamurella sp. 1534]
MRERILLAGLCGGYFLILLDVTVVAVALPAIGDDLGAAGLARVVDGYTLPLALLLLPAGVLGDRIGHRRVVLAGLAVVGAASAVCAAAPSMAVLAGGRFAQGVGAALLLPGTLALVTALFPAPGRRARAIGVWSALGGLALPAGPLIGGALTGSLGWRSVFWIALPVLGIVAVAVAACPAGRGNAPSPRDLRHAPRRLFLAAGIAGAMNLCTVGMLFLVTQWLQVSGGLTPMRAGLALLPVFAPMPLLGPAVGRAVARRGAWLMAAAGLLIAAAGLGSLAVTGGGPSWPAGAGMLAWGVGIAVLTPAIVTAAMEQLPAAPGLASGLSNAARQAGTTVGVGLFAALAGPASSGDFARGLAVAAAVAGATYAVLAVVTARVRPC